METDSRDSEFPSASSVTKASLATVSSGSENCAQLLKKVSYFYVKRSGLKALPLPFSVIKEVLSIPRSALIPLPRWEDVYGRFVTARSEERTARRESKAEIIITQSHLIVLFYSIRLSLSGSALPLFS